jgi:hypothetical protein
MGPGAEAGMTVLLEQRRTKNRGIADADLRRLATASSCNALRHSGTTGKSAKACPALRRKIFCCFANANHRLMVRVSLQQEGRLATSRNAGRDAVAAAAPSRVLCARTNGAIADGEVVWS